VLRDGTNGRLLVTCWGGCDRLDVLTELRQRGLLSDKPDYALRFVSSPHRRDDASRTARALNIWRNTRHGAGTIVARYLASRGIMLDEWPASLRFHPRCPRPRDDTRNLLSPLPAMVGLVEHVERGPIAVHATYLKTDGSGKADIEKPKAIFGPVAGGAMQFGTRHVGKLLAVAEGIETALSVAVACSMPVWAALSAPGIRSLVLPSEATDVVVCADNDTNGTGKRAAHDAAARWLSESRRVRIAMPPEPGMDFSDVLTSRTATKGNGARNVA
jgi:hypothetical protein